MMLGAGMLIVLTLLNWPIHPGSRELSTMWTGGRGRTAGCGGGRAYPAPDRNWRGGGDPSWKNLPGACSQRAIRCAHCRATNGLRLMERQPRSSLLSPEEALDVLGLAQGASASAIRAAHRRLVQLVHPDRGGSNYLAAKIDEVRRTFCLRMRRPRSPRVGTRGKARAASRQATADGGDGVLRDCAARKTYS